MGTKNTRLLAAVMFTDIVGYTAMMQDDEAKANRQRDRHREVLQERAAEFDGQILHYRGDGALTIFSSAYNAVMCSIKIQNDLSDPLLPLRIGIHMGDIIYTHDDAYGNAVNIASRLESLSVSGGILISEKVAEEIKNHRQITTVELGKFELKNVQHPINIFAVCNEGLQVPSSKEIRAKNGRMTTRVAVLPFVNMSDEISFDYFSDGLTEEIINGLTKIKTLDVSSRTSAFAYKGRNEDIRDIGEKLSVSHVLEGSVRKYKDKIRVTAQLIETDGGFHLWSETYERHLKDIFEIQDIICEEILDKFRLGFVEQADFEEPLQTLSSNQYAYDSYLEGKFHWDTWRVASVKKALQCFKSATDADPEFAEAYARLASSYCYLGMMGQMSAQLAYKKAAHYAQKALSLNSNAAEAHAANGLVQAFMHYDYQEAQHNFTRALETVDNLPFVFHTYAIFLRATGEIDEALRSIEHALDIDPMNTLYNSELAHGYYYARRFPEALEQHKYTLELDPSFLTSIENKGWTYFAMGEHKSAHQVFETFQKLVSHEQKNVPQLAFMAAQMGLSKAANHFLELVQIGSVSDRYITTPMDIALIYLGLGKYDEVFFHLQRALEDKVGRALYIFSDPIWDPIRQDSRYDALLEEVNLAPEHVLHQNTTSRNFDSSVDL